MNTRGQAQILLVGVLFFMAFILTGGFVSTQKTSIRPKPGFALNNTPVINPDHTASSNLQLKSLTFITGAPTPIPQPPQNQCSIDQGQDYDASLCSCNHYIVTCENQQCTHIENKGPLLAHGNLTCDDLNNGFDAPATFSSLSYINGGWCARDIDHIPLRMRPQFIGANGISNIMAPHDGTYCMSKPVIYLYPPIDTLSTVTLSIPGKITASIPEYGGGWKDVLAHPNGNLEYKGNKYTELFYESSIQSFKHPNNGFIIPKKILTQELSRILIVLGLNTPERNEFIDYWVPRLETLPGNYILFSLIDPQEKERIDHVEIVPRPNTRIEFLAYFKPLDYPILIDSLILPKNPPKRIGFTEVEWGGTIDTNSSYQTIF